MCNRQHRDWQWMGESRFADSVNFIIKTRSWVLSKSPTTLVKSKSRYVILCWIGQCWCEIASFLARIFKTNSRCANFDLSQLCRQSSIERIYYPASIRLNRDIIIEAYFSKNAPPRGNPHWQLVSATSPVWRTGGSQLAWCSATCRGKRTIRL